MQTWLAEIGAFQPVVQLTKGTCQTSGLGTVRKVDIRVDNGEWTTKRQDWNNDDAYEYPPESNTSNFDLNWTIGQPITLKMYGPGNFYLAFLNWSEMIAKEWKGPLALWRMAADGCASGPAANMSFAVVDQNDPKKHLPGPPLP